MGLKLKSLHPLIDKQESITEALIITAARPPAILFFIQILLLTFRTFNALSFSAYYYNSFLKKIQLPPAASQGIQLSLKEN